MRQVTELGGSYKTAARPYIPVQLHEVLRDNQIRVIEEIEVGGMLAPGSFIPVIHGERLQVVDAVTLRRSLSLPAMSEVRTLKLSGTAVSDALIDDLAKLSGLQTVQFYQTAVTEEGAQRLRLALPGCTVTWGSSVAFTGPGGWQLTPQNGPHVLGRSRRRLQLTPHNGPHVVERSHRRLLQFLGDISVFTHAQEGDRQAVRRLLGRIGEAPWPEVSSLREELGAVQSSANVHLLHDALKDDNPTVRRFLIATLDGDARILERALADPVIDIRLEAIGRMPTLQRQQAVRLLHVAIENESAEVRERALRQMEQLGVARLEVVLRLVTADPSPQVRWKAVDILEQFEEDRVVDALVAALEDQEPLVRSAAARSLGSRGEKRAAEALQALLDDDDPHVQARARDSLKKLVAQ